MRDRPIWGGSLCTGGVHHPLSIQNKLFCAYAALIAVVVVAVVALLLIFTRSANRDLERFHQQEVLASDMQELLSVFDGMDTLASQVASNTELLNFFIPLQDDETPENYFRAHLMDSIRAGSLLATINSTDRRALRISVFNEHGDYISAGSLYETDEEIAATLGSSDAFAQMERQLGAGGGVVVSGPHADYWSAIRISILFSLVRPLSTSYSSKVYGYISVQQSADVLHSLSLWDRGDGASYVLLDASGEDASPAGGPALPEAVLADLPAPGESAEYALDMDGGMSVFAMRDPFSGWTLVRLLPASLLDTPYQQGLPADPAGGACVAGHFAGGGLLAGGQDLAPAARIFRGHRAHQSGQPRQRYTPAFQFLHGGIAGPGPHLPRHAAQAQPVHRL